MTATQPLLELSPGMRLVVSGNRVVEVTPELAARFQPGDSLVFAERTSELLHIPKQEAELAHQAVTRAVEAFAQMRAVTDEQICAFFELFAQKLEHPETWAAILQVNDADVAQAKALGRSTTRLVATELMRKNMVEGLRVWAEATSLRGKVMETVDHGSWKAELIGAELGAIAFIFEGRPNVVADATGVLRSGNSVVFRIGRDALATARAIVELAVLPSLRTAGLPEGAVSLVESPAHSAGWALFRDSRLSLAVARGSGPAVATLGSLAQGAGVPVSLHGQGGAWMVCGPEVSPARLAQNVYDSLDRKVCNTLNTVCLPRALAYDFVPALLQGLERAAERRGAPFKLHVVEGDQREVPAELFTKQVSILRAEGPVQEAQAELISGDQLGREWEWEDSPELTLKLVDSLDEAIELFNAQSPHFVVSLLTDDSQVAQHFYQKVDAPFVGDGFTRWVDGQYALGRPELGLTNWENGRLFGRGGILTGEGVYTVRTRVSGTREGKPQAG